MSAPTLTARQTQCLRLIAAGDTAHDAAEQLGLTYETVRNYVRSARQRLGANTTAHACALAVAHGIVTAEHLGLKEDA